MAKKGVEDMINEIGIFIDSCKYQPLSSNKIIVPKDELMSMLSELKLKMPVEIERSQKIMRTKEVILADARTKADTIIEDATRQSADLVEDHEIVRLANIRAEEIMKMAKAEAQGLVEDANADANEIRMGSMYYTKDMLSDIEGYIFKAIEAQKQSFDTLLNNLQNDALVVSTNKQEIEDQINDAILANQAKEAGSNGGIENAAEEDVVEDEEITSVSDIIAASKKSKQEVEDDDDEDEEDLVF